MFAVRMESVKALNNWLQCDTYFWSKRKPRNTMHWTDSERPLRPNESESRHLKLVRRDSDESYGLKLYDSILVRYYRPERLTGRVTVDLYLPSQWNTQSTGAFLYNAGWWHNKQFGALRRRQPVRLALYPSSENDGWSAHLEFNRDGKLDPIKSWHLQSYTEQTNEAGKRFREQAAQALQPLAFLLSLTQQGMVAQPDFKRLKQPFKEMYRHLAPRNQLDTDSIPQVIEMIRGERERLDEEALQGLVKWMQRTIDVYATNYRARLALTEEAITGRLVRMAQEELQHTFAVTQQPNKMWPVHAHPSNTTQYFGTRAQAAKAAEKNRKAKAVDSGV